MRVVTLGDLLLDVVVRLEAAPANDDDVPATIALVPGGQAANVAAWARWLGAEARLIARRTDDSAGRLIADELERRGVELAGPLVPGERTGSVVALVAPDGARTLASDRGAAGELAAGDVAADMLEGGDVLHVAGYTLMREAGAEAALRLAEAARRYGARVTVDLSTAHGIAQLGRDEMRRRVRALAPDVVFANEAEAAAFGARLDCVWVVKRGALGCTVEHGDERADHARRRRRARAGHDRARATPSRRASCSRATSSQPPIAARSRRAASTRVGALP